MKKYVLLTGATGLVGRYLIRDLLLAGHRLAVVVRASEKETPAQRIEGIIQSWEEQLGNSLPRPVVLEGDVTDPGFGFSPRTLAWVREHCNRILHNAAILTFYGADRNGEPWRTNLNGVRHALELCEQVGIEEFHHVSTAYVSGTRTDVAYENELDVGQQFRNDYEESKFVAEKLVRSATFLRSLTVYRPAVIAGDSVTGYTATYHGLYHYLKLMSVLNRNVEPDANGLRHTPLQLKMTGDEPRNIVPVDWVSAVMCKIFANPVLHGKTYHLSPRECITPRMIIQAGYDYFHSCGVEFVGPDVQEFTPISGIDQAAKDNMRMYEPYENSDPLFDTSNLNTSVPELPCPAIDNEMLQRFLQFGEQDRWGKRRSPKPNVPFWVEQFLEEEAVRPHPGETPGEVHGKDLCSVGLNVFGPGGGQYSLEFNGERLARVTPGLRDGYRCVNLSSADFARLVQKNERLTALDLLQFAQGAESLDAAQEVMRDASQGSLVSSGESDSTFTLATRPSLGE